MPCNTSLSSVLRNRTVRSAYRSGTVCFQGTRTRSFHDDPDAPQTPLSRRLIGVRDKPVKAVAAKKSKALRRLDKVIDPDDLSATLEAHRDSNRASVIRTIRSWHADPDVLRPSFLKSKPVERLPKARGQKSEASHAHEAREVGDGALSLPASTKHSRAEPQTQSSTTHEELVSANTATRSALKRFANNLPRHPSAQDLLLARFDVPEMAKSEAKASIDKRNGHPLEQKRRVFLARFERPLGHMMARTRNGYFDTIRRVRRVIQTKQKEVNTKLSLHSIQKDLLEYTGRLVPLTPSKGNPSTKEPWTQTSSSQAHTPQEQLELELKAFAQWMEPTAAEEAAREAVFEEALKIVHEEAPDIQVEKFGSQTTGLAMPMSDIDIRLFPKDFELELKRDPLQNTVEANLFMTRFDAVLAAFKQHPDFSLVNKHHGRFPLLGATHKPTGLALQLVAARDTSASREHVKTYLAAWPTLKTLYMVVKTVFDMRGLSDVWFGGLGSYGIFMLVVASLKNKNLERNGLQVSLAQQLLDFFDFVGSLNTYVHGVGVDPPRLFKKKSIPSGEEVNLAKTSLVSHGQNRIQYPSFYQRYLLCLQDPADPVNDLGKNTHAIKDIQITLKHLHNSLKRSLDNMDTPNKTYRSRPILRDLVGRCDQLYDDNRIKLDIFGEELLEAKGARTES